MKKLLLISLLLLTIKSFAQFPNTVYSGSKKQISGFYGAVKGDSGIIISNFNDTSLANGQQMKNTAGILIKVKDTLYLRADCLCKWIKVGTLAKEDSFKMMYPLQVYDSAGLSRVRIAYSWQDSALANSGGSGWGLNGNSITSGMFLGTTNIQDLILKANNTEYARIKTTGNFGIGTTNPTSLLEVNGITKSKSLILTSQELAPDGLKSSISNYGIASEITANSFASGYQEYGFVVPKDAFKGYIGMQSWAYVYSPTTVNPYDGFFGKFKAYISGFSSNQVYDNVGSNMQTALGYFSALNVQNGTVENAYDFYAAELNSTNVTTRTNPSVTNHYTLYSEPRTRGINNWFLYNASTANNVLGSGKTGINVVTPDSTLSVNGGIKLQGLYPSTDATDSALVIKANGGVGKRAISGGGTTKYTTNGYGILVDSTTNLYTIRADTNITAKLRDAAINSKLNINNPTATGILTTTNLNVTGRAVLDGIELNKDSIPINTTNINILTIDTSTNRMARRTLASLLTSAALTGTPTAPTAALGTNTTQVATTEYVQSNSITSNYLNNYRFFTDFISGYGTVTNSSELFATSSGTGAGFTMSSEAGRPGVYQAGTGTTATGRTALTTPNTSTTLGGGIWTYETIVQVPTLSNGTERFQLIAGFLDNNTGANQVDGIYFLYDEGGVSTGSAASANWQIATSSNSSRTFPTPSVAVTVTANQWYKLKIVVNATASSVEYFVDNASIGIITTNIPSGTSRQLGWGFLQNKSLGTTSRLANFDLMFVEGKLTTSR